MIIALSDVEARRAQQQEAEKRDRHSLNSDLRNSIWPCAPKMRFQPLEIDKRDSCGRTRSTTSRGAFCRIDDRMPAAASTTTAGSSSAAPPCRWPGTAGSHRRCSRATSRRVVDQPRERHVDAGHAADQEEAGDDEHAEQRGERCRLPRGRNEAALEGIAHLLLGRLLGLAFLVGCLGHARCPLRPRCRRGHRPRPGASRSRPCRPA